MRSKNIKRTNCDLISPFREQMVIFKLDGCNRYLCQLCKKDHFSFCFFIFLQNEWFGLWEKHTNHSNARCHLNKDKYTFFWKWKLLQQRQNKILWWSNENREIINLQGTEIFLIRCHTSLRAKEDFLSRISFPANQRASLMSPKKQSFLALNEISIFIKES